jgi:hypothetical protein
MAKRARLVVTIQVETVPLPEGQEPAWRAGLSLLLQLLRGAHSETAQDHAPVCEPGNMLSTSALFVSAAVAEPMEVQDGDLVFMQ